MSSFPFASYLVAAVFALAVGTTLAGALIAVSSHRVIRAVTGLMICCVGLAGLYYFLNSPFLALMEILIYVGAVCVTIVFGVMLAEPDWPVDLKQARALHKTLLAIAVSAVIGLALARLALQGPWPATPASLVNDGSVAAIGTSLLTTYSFVFELISLVLLVAILGALVIARAGRSRTVTGLGTFAEERAGGPAPASGEPVESAAGREGLPASGNPTTPPTDARLEEAHR